MCHKTLKSKNNIQKHKKIPHAQLTCSFQTCLITERVASFQHKDDFSSAKSFSAGSLALAADLLEVCLHIICYELSFSTCIKLFQERLSYQGVTAYTTNVKLTLAMVVYGCLTEALGVLAWKKKTASAYVFMLSPSFLWISIKQHQLLLPINLLPIEIVT